MPPTLPHLRILLNPPITRPSSAVQPGSPLAPLSSAQASLDPLLSVGSSAMGSWSLWDQSSSASSFYEQLQAAASDSFSCAGSSGHGSAPLNAGLPFQQQQQQQQQQAHYHSQQLQQQHEQQQHHLPSASPFPGLGRPGMGLSSLGFSPIGPHLGHQIPASAASLDAEREMQQLLAAVASMATHEC
jgi:hypothetical protein